MRELGPLLGWMKYTESVSGEGGPRGAMEKEKNAEKQDWRFSNQNSVKFTLIWSEKHIVKKIETKYQEKELNLMKSEGKGTIETKFNQTKNNGIKRNEKQIEESWIKSAQRRKKVRNRYGS